MRHDTKLVVQVCTGASAAAYVVPPTQAAASPALPAYAYFVFNDTMTTQLYTLSLHDALPISPVTIRSRMPSSACEWRDRKSTRLNSSHDQISYAVFCLKKKNQKAIGCQLESKTQPVTDPPLSLATEPRHPRNISRL